ncbi:MAG TPA: phytoene dehydrogenase, partial [Anaeromyxobacteraceae bacterium]|jgi:hypothetical protein
VDHDGVSAAYADGGWLLPLAPALLPSPRLFPAGEAALSELGLASDVGRALEPATPDLQLVLPRARLDLWRDPVRRAAELRREWPAEAAALDAALTEASRLFDSATPFLAQRPPLAPSGLRQRWALSRLLRVAEPFPGSPAAPGLVPLRDVAAHPLALALGAARRFLGHLDGPAPPLAAARLLGALTRGVHRAAGGGLGLRDLVRRRIAESRGELLGAGDAPAVAEALELEGRRAAALRVAGYRDLYRARVFLVATDAPALRRLLPEDERTGRRARALEAVRPRRQLFAVNWVVRAGGLPPGLGELALSVAAPGAEGPAGGILLQVGAARRAGGGAPDDSVRVLTAAAFFPEEPRGEGAGAAAAAAAQAAAMRGALSELLPFLDRQVVLESVPAQAAPSGRRGSRLAVHPLLEVAAPGALGVAGLPVESPWPNLLFAGREVVPGLGLEGEFHAGLAAAEAAERLLGRR